MPWDTADMTQKVVLCDEKPDVKGKGKFKSNHFLKYVTAEKEQHF